MAKPQLEIIYCRGFAFSQWPSTRHRQSGSFASWPLDTFQRPL